MDRHIGVKPEIGKKFYLDYKDKGKIVMLNLLKYRTKADYTNFENLKPEKEISGEEAYELYMKHTLPELIKAGGKVLFFGKSKHFLIGPENEDWDVVLLVEHESVDTFLAFTKNEDYLKTAGHRNAALENSRLLPITESKK